MRDIILFLGLFATIILLMGAAYLVLRNYLNSESRTVSKRLKALSEGTDAVRQLDIVKKERVSDIDWLDALLSKFRHIYSLKTQLDRANIKKSPSTFILLSIFLALLGLIGGSLVTINRALWVVPMLFLGLSPFLYIYSKKQARMSKFQEQLPEALDLVARALKAGHAFSSGMRMVAEEFRDPVGTEFRRTLEEINFGVGIEEAMKNFANRIDSPDLRFFVVSVLVQRETGGNLAEILENLAQLIRERFRLYGKIRSLAAEGKLSAIILCMLPPFMAGYFLIVRPSYLALLFQDQLGISMVIFALVMMTLGVIVMKKMIDIRV